MFNSKTDLTLSQGFRPVREWGGLLNNMDIPNFFRRGFNFLFLNEDTVFSRAENKKRLSKFEETCECCGTELSIFDKYQLCKKCDVKMNFYMGSYMEDSVGFRSKQSENSFFKKEEVKNMRLDSYL